VLYDKSSQTLAVYDLGIENVFTQVQDQAAYDLLLYLENTSTEYPLLIKAIKSVKPVIYSRLHPESVKDNAWFTMLPNAGKNLSNISMRGQRMVVSKHMKPVALTGRSSIHVYNAEGRQVGEWTADGNSFPISSFLPPNISNQAVFINIDRMGFSSAGIISKY